MFKKKLLGLLVLGITAVSAIGFANAPHCHRSQMMNCPAATNYMQVQGEQMEVKNTLATNGEIVAIGEDGLVTVKGEGDYPLISLRIVKASKNVDNCGGGKATQIYKTDGKKLAAKHLEIGMKVSCYYDSRVTRSYPGQANAKAIIVSEAESGNRVTLLNVSKVLQEENKPYITIEASNNELIASIDKKAYKYYDQIMEGDEVLIWYGIMTMSLPPRTGAAKAIVL